MRKNKNRKPNKYIVGKATDGNGNIKTVARKFHYIIGRIAIKTDPSLVKTFLADKIKSDWVAKLKSNKAPGNDCLTNEIRCVSHHCSIVR